MRHALGLTLSLLTLTAPARAVVVWTGDLETGDLDQWEYKLNESGISVVQDPVTQGQYAAHITLTNADTWSNGLHRVELNHAPEDARTAEGAELYFAWSFYLPAALPDTGQQIGYWESGQSYQQMMAFSADAGDLTFLTQQPSYVEHWTGSGVLTPNTWHRIAMFIKWSKDPAVGYVDVWFDGTQVVTNAAAKTLNDDNPHFTQVGLLRGTDPFTDEPEIVIDNALEGDSLEDVQGVPATTDGGAGSAGAAGAASGGGGTSSGGSGGVAAGGGSGGATSDSGVGGGAAKPAGSDDDGGCGCGVPGHETAPRASWLLALAALSLIARRRFCVWTGPVKETK